MKTLSLLALAVLLGVPASGQAPSVKGKPVSEKHRHHHPKAAPAPAGLQMPKGHLPLPILMQETDYSCGAAALLSVLRYWQVFEGNERDLYGPLQTTPNDGTEPQSLAAFARKQGLKAEMKEKMTLEDLRAALKDGVTVIVDIQAWRDESEADTPWEDLWEDGHYVVLSAMDSKNAYFMDPSVMGTYAFIPLSELPGRWHDYEDRDGTLKRYYQLGILIKGKQPLDSAPVPIE
ncbi:MAG TPA: hypothetical protein DCM05_05495 [Elusimicrobia bacterium]|nr:hypothetical protein [Elusimicrobiota bacterium]